MKNKSGHTLSAPIRGKMARNIIEIVSCKAEFAFYIADKLIFHKKSNHTSFEFES